MIEALVAMIFVVAGTLAAAAIVAVAFAIVEAGYTDATGGEAS